MDADRTTAYLSVPICGETFQVTDREGDEWIVACIESADKKHFYHKGYVFWPDEEEEE